MEANFSENILSFIARSEEINYSANESEGSCLNSSSTIKMTIKQNLFNVCCIRQLYHNEL